MRLHFAGDGSSDGCLQLYCRLALVSLPPTRKVPVLSTNGSNLRMAQFFGSCCLRCKVQISSAKYFVCTALTSISQLCCRSVADMCLLTVGLLLSTLAARMFLNLTHKATAFTKPFQLEMCCNRSRSSCCSCCCYVTVCSTVAEDFTSGSSSAMSGTLLLLLSMMSGCHKNGGP